MAAMLGSMKIIMSEVKMMAKNPFVCAECSVILPDPEKKNDIPQCNRCPSAQVTTDWQGYVIIMNPERSEIAKRLNVDRPGKYALKVNIR